MSDFNDNSDEQLLEPLIRTESAPETLAEDAPVAYKDAVIEIFSQAGCIGLSYTASFSFIVLAILAGHMKQEGDDDTDYLSATTLITSTLYPTFAIGTSSVFSVLYYIMEKLGKYNDPKISAGEKEDCRREIARLVKNIFLFSMVSLPVVATLLVFFLSKPIMQSLFSQNESDVDLAQDYLNIAAWSILPIAMRLGFEQILFPFNKQVQVMKLALGTFALGVTFAAISCYVLGLKLQGIAIAFLLEACATALAFGLYLNSSQDLKEFQFFNAGWYDFEDFKQISTLSKIGGPISVSISSELIAFFLINQFAGWLGDDELAAQDLASQVFFITFVPSFALAQVAAIKTGGAIGQKAHENTVIYARSGVLAVTLAMGVVCLLPLLVCPDIMRYVIAGHISKEVADIAMPAVRIAAVTAFFMAISNVLLQTVRCVNPTDFTPTFISSIAAFLGAALSYLLGIRANWGLNGVLGGYGMGVTAGALALLVLSSTRLTVDALKERQVKLDSQAQASAASESSVGHGSGYGRLMNAFGWNATPQYQLVLNRDEEFSAREASMKVPCETP